MSFKPLLIIASETHFLQHLFSVRLSAGTKVGTKRSKGESETLDTVWLWEAPGLAQEWETSDHCHAATCKGPSYSEKAEITYVEDSF